MVEWVWIGGVSGATLLLAWTVKKLLTRSLGAVPSGPRNIVITGGTKGLGLALAEECLQQGHYVFLCSRKEENVAEALKYLEGKCKSSQSAAGCITDVSQWEDVVQLSDQARKSFAERTSRGDIDIWINNAGISHAVLTPLVATDPAEIQAIVNVNLTGTLYCTKAASECMQQQTQGGHIFLMEGAGSTGMSTPRFATYGVSKAGYPQLLKSLVKEHQKTQVGVHVLSPGMVITDLLMKSGSEGKSSTYRIFNILAEKPSTVARWLVPRVLSSARPGCTGTKHRFLTPVGAMWRFATFFTRRNRLIDEKTGRVL